MKRDETRLRELMSQSFGVPDEVPLSEVEETGKRVLRSLQREPEWEVGSSVANARVTVSVPRRPLPAIVLCAAGVALVVSASVVLIRNFEDRQSAAAAIETIDGALFRVFGQNSAFLRVGERVADGQTIRSNGNAGGTVVLADGSRVEVRSRSEVSFQREADGVRIRLGTGSILIDAARQPAGQHLYVQTRDVVVSVVGTVFLVNAEEQGSRVAVIEGEVRVQQGASEKKLLSGEQVATDPSMTATPVKEEISWSRNAEAHLALLEQSAVRSPAEVPLAFEVVSIRASVPPPAGGRGSNTTEAGCTAGSVQQLDPRRLVVTNANLYTLITLAYGTPGRDCGYFGLTGLISGGPGWIKGDQFDIQATIPEGVPGYTRDQLRKGDAPKLQMMLQALLGDRFKLKLRRETREMAAHALMLGSAKTAAQFAGLAAESVRRSPLNYPNPEQRDSVVVPIYMPSNGTEPARPPGRIVALRNAPMSDLALHLTSLIGRPVVDQTGLTGLFSLDLQFETVNDSIPGIQGLGRPLGVTSASLLITALQEKLGLKLEATRAPVETFVIESAEKPSEN
jgi:uncharacterized protein (TIGR03435 family)